MSPDKRQHLTLAGALAAVSAIGTAAYVGIDKVVELDGKIGTSATATATLVHTDARIFELLRQQERRIAKLEKRRPRVAQIDSLAAAVPPPQSGGLVSRVFRLLF